MFFGSWGLVRKRGHSKVSWDKFDGKIFGLRTTNGRELWPPIHPGVTPYAYRFPGRKPTRQDRPAGNGLHLNYSNGTIEGTPAVDPTGKVAFVGRGDGSLYCVDLIRGKVKWRFKTFDPARPDDPEGGGEIVGGPALTPQGLVIFGTFAAPHRPNPPKLVRHETNAVYAVDTKGQLVWRYPKQGSLDSVFQASPALSTYSLPVSLHLRGNTKLRAPELGTELVCRLLSLEDRYRIRQRTPPRSGR